MSKPGEKEKAAAAAREAKATPPKGTAASDKSPAKVSDKKPTEPKTRKADGITIQDLQRDYGVVNGQLIRDILIKSRGHGLARGERYLWPNKQDPEFKALIKEMKAQGLPTKDPSGAPVAPKPKAPAKPRTAKPKPVKAVAEPEPETQPEPAPEPVVEPEPEPVAVPEDEVEVPPPAEFEPPASVTDLDEAAV